MRILSSNLSSQLGVLPSSTRRNERVTTSTATERSGSGGSAQWYAGGVWMIYDFSEKLPAALRADDLSDRDGNRTSGFLFPENTGQDLWSLTLTLNIKPVEGLRLAPEIRYDHSSLHDAFDNHDDQVTAAIGAVYSF